MEKCKDCGFWLPCEKHNKECCDIDEELRNKK